MRRANRSGWWAPLACLALCATLALPAAADWQPDQPYKWVQYPDLSPMGIDVNASEPYILADDFECTQPGLITQFHVWGSWIYDEIPGGDPHNVVFTLSIHRDIPAEESPTGYSMPGEVLWMHTFQPGEFVAMIWEEGIMEGWMDPPEQYFFPADHICWLYNFYIDPTQAFYQEGSPDQPVVYWLDVQARPMGAGYRFGWKTSLDHWNDDAVWGMGDEPYMGPWYELIYPPGHEMMGQSIDLAFVVVGEETPTDWGDAPDPTYPTMSWSNGARHVIVPNIYLGASIDQEPDGQQDPNALGDDNDGNDDEDGVVFLTPLIPNQPAMMDVTASVNGFLDVWLDVDADGTWMQASDQILGAYPLNPGVNTISFTVPPSATGAGNYPTFMRFRFSTIGGLSYDGPAWDGEVEDYQVWIEEPETLDWGDAPDPAYPTMSWSNGANHRIVPGFHLGASVDADPDGQQDPNALGDDNDGNDDEDGVAFLTPLVAGQTATIDVTASTYGQLDFWLDADADGSWYEPQDLIFAAYPLAPGVNTINFTVPTSPSGMVNIVTFMRFRFSANGGLPCDGPASEGEVEDYEVFVEEPEEYDWGDAPDPTYPTYALSNGAVHRIVPNLFLGASIDPEPNGQPDLNALGDDNDGNDDEDGVLFGTPWIPGQPTTITVTASAPGLLSIWVDWNVDGGWAESIDYVIADQALVAGPNGVSFYVPNSATYNADTFMRVRYSTVGGLAYVGMAPDGEVEDYKVHIDEPAQEWKWEQEPDLSIFGIDVECTEPFILADDFPCTATGPITVVDVFGSWLYDELPDGVPFAVEFTLSIHEDIPASANPDGYSKPGQVLWLQHFPAGAFEVMPYAENIEEGWLTPPIDYLFPADWTCWRYRFDLTGVEELFFQMGTPDHPVVYWLDVQARPLAPARFGWKTSVMHWNDDAVWGMGAEPYPGPWEELRYPPGHEWHGESIDLAYRLYGPPEEIPLDFGDAPDPTYPTLLASNGARHRVVPGVFMGPATGVPGIDAEPDGQPDPNAMGDDLNGIDDENGATFMTPISPGGACVVDVEVSVDGYLWLWIDMAGDGSFAQPEDRMFGQLALTAGLHSIGFPVPETGVMAHPSFARFRFCRQPLMLLGPDGPAPDGEVEDYSVWIEDDLTGVEDQVPERFGLHQNSPNPFNPKTTLRYDVPAGGGDVQIEVFDVSGRLVRVLLDSFQPAGRHAVAWDGRDASGRAQPSGVYFARLRAPDTEQIRRMVLLQ